MDKEDIYDLIAYIRTLEPLENKIPVSKVYFPMRFFINTIPQEAAFTLRPQTSDKRAYGKFLVNASSCIECHTPSTIGKLVTEIAYAGGREFLMPHGILTFANNTPDPITGIDTWTEKNFIAKAFDPSHPVAEVGPEEFNTISPERCTPD